MNNINYITIKVRTRTFCRWWLKGKQENNIVKFYVPLWAWPFELAHRLIFGSTKIKKI